LLFEQRAEHAAQAIFIGSLGNGFQLFDFGVAALDEFAAFRGDTQNR
jgi:hypothetical protein